MSGVENWPIWSWAVLLFNTTDWEKGPWIIKSQSVFELRSMTQPYKTAVRKLKARWPRLCIFYSHCGHRHWDPTFSLLLCLLLSLLLFPHKPFERRKPKILAGTFKLQLPLCFILIIILILTVKQIVLLAFYPLLHRKLAHYNHPIWIILGANPQKCSQEKVNWALGATETLLRSWRTLRAGTSPSRSSLQKTAILKAFFIFWHHLHL